VNLQLPPMRRKARQELNVYLASRRTPSEELRAPERSSARNFAGRNSERARVSCAFEGFGLV
jgi:hypothetical protein